MVGPVAGEAHQAEVKGFCDATTVASLKLCACRYVTQSIAAPTSPPSTSRTPGRRADGRIFVNGLRVTTPGAWEYMYRVLKANNVR